MALRTQRKRARHSRSRPPQSSRLPTRSRHHRREQRTRLAAQRRYSLDQAQAGTCSATGEGRPVELPFEPFGLLTTLLFGTALAMFAVGVIRTLDNARPDIRGRMAAVILSMICAVIIGVRCGSRELLVCLWERLRRRWTDRVGSSWKTNSTGRPGPIEVRDLSLPAMSALLSGIMLVLSPSLLQAVVFLGDWFGDAFLWSSPSEFVLWTGLSLLTVAAPVASTVVVWRCTVADQAAWGPWNSPVALSAVAGGVLGIAGAHLVTNTGASSAAIIYASSMPCFLQAIISLGRGSGAPAADESVKTSA